ncbi:hypothetical protein GCM10017711_33320 [Paeniglutamicibacter sulfureus]
MNSWHRYDAPLLRVFLERFGTRWGQATPFVGQMVGRARRKTYSVQQWKSCKKGPKPRFRTFLA